MFSELVMSILKGSYNLFYVLKQIEGIKSILHVATDKIFCDEYIRSTSEADSVIHPYNASKVCGDILANMYRESFDFPIVRMSDMAIFMGQMIYIGIVSFLVQSKPVTRM